METLKKQTNIGGDVKETDKYWWRRERKRKTLGETLKKPTDIHGDVKETDKYWWRR